MCISYILAVFCTASVGQNDARTQHSWVPGSDAAAVCEVFVSLPDVLKPRDVQEMQLSVFISHLTPLCYNGSDVIMLDQQFSIWQFYGISTIELILVCSSCWAASNKTKIWVISTIFAKVSISRLCYLFLRRPALQAVQVV